jgi:hypothetical protein
MRMGVMRMMTMMMTMMLDATSDNGFDLDARNGEQAYSMTLLIRAHGHQLTTHATFLL